MINPNTKLTVFHNTNDRSLDAFDFTRDPFSLTLLTTDSLYVGFYKPINSLYVALNTVNSNTSVLALEYWDGSDWVALSNSFDDTRGFKRSGFITWDRNQVNQAKHTVNSLEKFWIRIKTSVSTSSCSVQAINFLFADDQDLVAEVPEITDANHLAGKTSHLNTHVAVRSQLIQDLNNKDYKKYNPDTGLDEDLTCWDILDINQLKQAAVFLALAKIYFNFSDAPDDKYYQKYTDYMGRYKDAYELSRLALDADDDGQEDDNEDQEAFSVIRFKR